VSWLLQKIITSTLLIRLNNVSESFSVSTTLVILCFIIFLNFVTFFVKVKRIFCSSESHTYDYWHYLVIVVSPRHFWLTMWENSLMPMVNVFRPFAYSSLFSLMAFKFSAKIFFLTISSFSSSNVLPIINIEIHRKLPWNVSFSTRWDITQEFPWQIGQAFS